MRHLALSSLVVLIALAGAVATRRAAVAQSFPDSIVITGAFGAALHTAPASDAPVVAVAPCGETFSVLGARDGWYETEIGGHRLWIGGARAADAYNPPYYTCAPYTFQVGDLVGTYVASGCLSLRDQPSRQATILACVNNDYIYTVFSGPVDPGTGEDWLQVSSPGTGGGWVLAQYLYPAD